MRAFHVVACCTEIQARQRNDLLGFAAAEYFDIHKKTNVMKFQEETRNLELFVNTLSISFKNHSSVSLASACKC